MKLLVLLLALTVAGFNSYSQESQEKSPEQSQEESIEQSQGQSVDQSQQQKKQINKEELPTAVVEEFNKSVYKEWTIDKVYMLEASNAVTYEIHLTQNDETMVLLADSQGVLQPKADS
jgi:hypothetical protein